MFILRINTLAKGRSGINPDNLARAIKAYNAGFFPLIPEQGTVGASGDLAPLSHLALGLLGQGKAWNSETKVFESAADLMKKLKLEKIDLAEKEGLALINGTQFMAAHISQALPKAEAVFILALCCMP